MQTKIIHQGTGSLKEELGLIAPELAEMRRRRDERRRHFLDVTESLNRIQQEISPGPGSLSMSPLTAPT